MFSKTAHYYDLIYSQFKDYTKEAAQVHELIARLHPNAHKILDVACGTAEHAKILVEKYGYAVDGIDLDPTFMQIASAKLKEGKVYEADMTSFELPNRYDVVMCLFSSIGYVRTLDGVRRTLQTFRKHLADGGIILVEPWFEPDVFVPGRFAVDVARSDDVVISRVSRTSRDDRLSRLHFEYLIGTSSGIEHTSEEHVLGLFTREEMMGCLEDCGLTATYDSVGLFGRGLYVAR